MIPCSSGVLCCVVLLATPCSRNSAASTDWRWRKRGGGGGGGERGGGDKETGKGKTKGKWEKKDTEKAREKERREAEEKGRKVGRQWVGKEKTLVDVFFKPFHCGMKEIICTCQVGCEELVSRLERTEDRCCRYWMCVVLCRDSCRREVESLGICSTIVSFSGSNSTASLVFLI